MARYILSESVCRSRVINRRIYSSKLCSRRTQVYFSLRCGCQIIREGSRSCVAYRGIYEMVLHCSYSPHHHHAQETCSSPVSWWSPVLFSGRECTSRHSPRLMGTTCLSDVARWNTYVMMVTSDSAVVAAARPDSREAGCNPHPYWCTHKLSGLEHRRARPTNI